MATRPMSHVPSLGRKQKVQRFLSTAQRTFVRELTDKVNYAARDVRPEIEHRQAFDDLACGRSSAVSRFAVMVDDLLGTSASTDDIAAIFEHGAVLVRARRAMGIAQPVIPALLAETRAESIENPLQDEVLADPNCPVKRRRLITVMSNSISKATNAVASLLSLEHKAAS